MSEQQEDDDVQETRTSACPHPEAVGKRWGDPIDEELQLDLQNYLDQWADESDHGNRVGPFHKVTLSGADVFWLAAQSGRDALGFLPTLHLEGAKLSTAHLEGADLVGSHLEGADLRETYLDGAHLSEAYLAGARLSEARLVGAEFYSAHLEGAVLFGALLGGGDLIDARLEGADLRETELEGTDLSYAHLEGADLRGARLSSKTVLSEAILDWRTRLGDIQWSGVGAVNLTQVDWRSIRRLGDETMLKADAPMEHYEAAVRAYRQVAAQLRAQGLSEVADGFLYRAQVVQRRVLRKQRKFGGYLFSLLLALLAGYGYRLGRILVAYALIVVVFAAAFFASDVLSGQTPLTVQHAFDTLQISLNAVHGRVFFAQFHLDTLQSWLATGESIIGIIVESVFVAMLIQRFFAR